MRPPFPDPEQLRPSLDEPTPYESVKQRCESVVARWTWATGPFWGLRPFDAEIGDWSRGRKLKAAPKDRDGKCQFGFDELDRLVVARKCVKVEGQYYETFYLHLDGGIVHHFYYGSSAYQKKQPITVARYEYQGSRIIRFSSLSRSGGSTAEVYEHDGDLLATIHRKSTTRNNTTFHSTYALSFVGDQLMAIQKVDSAGVRHEIYGRPARKLSNLLKTLRPRLVEQIQKVVIGYDLREPACCLALAYGTESSEEALPPILALGLENERDRWRSAAEQTAEAFWNPASFSTFDCDELELDDPATLSEADAIKHHLKDADNMNVVRKLLVQVAKKLNSVHWSEVIPVTQDFIVYAVDLEGSHWGESIKAAVPARKRKALQALGLIDG